MSAATMTVLKKLKDLSSKEFKKFKWLLQFTFFERSLPQIPWSQLEWAERPDILVELMVESLGHQSVEVTDDILTDMMRTETRSGLEGKTKT